MNADLNDWGGRLGALADFEPPAENWQAVLAARAARESQSVRRWPVVLAAATLAVTPALVSFAIRRALVGAQLTLQYGESLP